MTPCPHAVGAWLLACVALVVTPSWASAHETSVGFLQITVSSADVRVAVSIAAQDAAVLIGQSPLQRPSRHEVLTRQAHAQRYVQSRVVLTQQARPCAANFAEPVTLRDDPRMASWRVLVAVHYHCARVIDELTLRDDLFFDIDDNHRDLATIAAFGTVRDKVFGVYDRTLVVNGSPSTRAVVGAYFALGVTHIVTGYDHLAFVFALLLIFADNEAHTASSRGRRLLALLSVISGFTVAHSLTLAMAALRWVSPPVRFVECCIAASIGTVALGDLVTVVRHQVTSLRRRAVLAGLFGLVHGLGFAGALGELGLPPRALFRALIAFNLGVECAQLLLAALAFALLLWLSSWLVRRGVRFGRAVVIPTSAALVVLSTYWLVQRALS